jgi:hypothetical protein
MTICFAYFWQQIMNKKRKKGSPRIGGKRKFDPKVIKEKVLDYLDSNINKAYSSKQLIKRLNIRDSSSKAAVQPLLDMLAREMHGSPILLLIAIMGMFGLKQIS